MIFTDRTITVRKGESRIDEPIVVYRGDYELEVRFTILNSRFKFMSGTNMIESEKASYGQLAILTPYGGNIFSDIVRCSDGSVTFVLTAEMLNQIEEVGLYSFQIRLMDYNKESRVSIPPIEFGIEVREPIASEDHDNSVNNAIVGYSIAKVVDPKKENVGDTFDEDGNYNKTKWETGDRISEGKLNKIEDAIDKINRNEIGDFNILKKNISNNFNILDVRKADKDEVKLKNQLITLDDCDEELLGAIQNKQGETSFDLTSIPKDNSVTFGKMERDILTSITEFEKIDVEIVNGFNTIYTNYNDTSINDNYKTIKYICQDGQIFNCDCEIDTSSLSVVVFYKSDKTPLSSINFGVIGKYENFEFIIPKDACYLTVTSKHTTQPVLRKLKYIDIKDMKNDIAYDMVYGYTSLECVLSPKNTSITYGQIYNDNSKLTNANGFDTLYYKLSDDAISVNLKDFNIGYYGGSFVDDNMNGISSFSTSGSDIDMVIPENTTYIALTVQKIDRYGKCLYFTIEKKEIRFRNLNTDTSKNHWYNKKILWLGTSVPFGQSATKSYVSEASHILGYYFLNVSVPGLAIHTNDDGSQKTYGSLVLSKEEYTSQGVVIPDYPIPYIPGGESNGYYKTYENVFNENTSDYDLYVFDVVPNNDNFDLSDWNSFNKDAWKYYDDSKFEDHRSTFLGALIFLLDKLYKINPKARVVFVLGSKFVYEEGKEAFETIGKYYKIGIIDLWGKINLTPYTKHHIYANGEQDPHPSTYAHEIMGKLLANELLLII